MFRGNMSGQVVKNNERMVGPMAVQLDGSRFLGCPILTACLMRK